jgi:hypothetical protein
LKWFALKPFLKRLAGKQFFEKACGERPEDNYMEELL